MLVSTIAPIDIAVVALYLVGIIGLGLILSRRRATATDFFLADHGARWPTIGLSLVASNVSATGLIGITGSAYALGVSVYNYEWVASLILVLFATVFLPDVIRSGVFTMPEFLERRYDRRVRLWFAGLSLLLGILLDAAGLYGGALLLRGLIPSLSTQVAVAILAVMAGCCVVSGGLRAVMVTHTVQAVVVLSAALVLAIFAIELAGGLSNLFRVVDPAKLSLIQPASDPVMPWTGLLFGAPILSFYFWCTNQTMVQRMLAARTLRDAQMGALLAGFLKLLILFLVVLPGIAAIVLFPHLKHGDEAYPALLFGLMPPGLLGLSLAAFAGALLAQLSGAYLSAATLITMDIIRVAKPGLGEESLAKHGRVATVACILVSVLWAPQIERFPSLWQYLQAVLAYATPPVVALFIVGALWRGATAHGAIVAAVVGNGAGGVMLALTALNVIDLHFLHVAPLILIVTILMLVAVSLMPRTKTTIVEVEVAQHKGWPDSRLQFPGIEVGWWAAALVLASSIIVFWLR